jgi:DNA-binding MarR family transcriptional regulator
MAGEVGLSQLELQILHALPRAGSVEKLDKVTKVPPATLGRAIAKLQLAGYIGDDGRLTEKGQNAIRPL